MPTVPSERRVRLFRNGRNQAVRIPRDLELPGSEALLRKEGDRLIVEPMPRPSLLALLSNWEPLDEEFPPIDDLGQVDDVDLRDGPPSARHQHPRRSRS
jgi:antitoxin VapB